MKGRKVDQGIMCIRGLTPLTKRKFKATCAKLGYTQTEVIEALMRAFANNPHKFQVAKREKYRSRRYGGWAWAWMNELSKEEESEQDDPH